MGIVSEAVESEAIGAWPKRGATGKPDIQYGLCKPVLLKCQARTLVRGLKSPDGDHKYSRQALAFCPPSFETYESRTLRRPENSAS